MFENKNLHSIALGILTTLLTRLFGLSAADSAIIGTLIITVVKLYIWITDWVKSVNLKLSELTKQLDLLNHGMSAADKTTTLVNTVTQAQNQSQITVNVNSTSRELQPINDSSSVNQVSTLDTNTTSIGTNSK